MKKFFCVFLSLRQDVFTFSLFVLLLLSCSSLDEVNSRLDHLEGEVRDLKTAVTFLDAAYKDGKVITSITPNKDEEGNTLSWVICFSDKAEITIYNGLNGEALIKSVEIDNGLVVFVMADDSVFKFSYIEDIPKLLSLEFLAKDNATELIENVCCSIVGDSLVTCWVPYIMDDKQLIPHFTYFGSGVSAGGVEVISDKTRIDFSKPLTITVHGVNKQTNYTVYVHAFTGLPVMWIETENREPVTSKDDYLKAHMRLVEDVVTRGLGETLEADLEIKGRGNSTWGYEKKPYRLKFNSKISLLGEPEDKSWVLLANYLDKSFLRNRMAFYLGSISNLEYTPSSHFVELILNGKYNGTYELTEKIKISENRVNVGKDGFLIEIDALAKNEASAVYFMTEHIDQPVNINEPEVVMDDENYTYIKEFVQKAEETLYSDNFSNKNEGWQKYIDMDSFVDWYLINEISRNNDAWRWSSSFMNLKRGGKLKMGPIWDYDRSFGNASQFDNRNPEGFFMKDMGWYARLFQDPVFVTKVKERFDWFYGHKGEIIQLVNEDASYLHYSMIENNNKWGMLYNYISPNQDIWGNYENEVQNLKQWIALRFDWLKRNFEQL